MAYNGFRHYEILFFLMVTLIALLQGKDFYYRDLNF